VVVRTVGDPRSAEPLIRGALRAADPTLALRSVQTLDVVLGSSLSARRFALGPVSCFAAVALILAAVGIYGVLAFSVTSRTREFGVRLALGARRSSVLLLVLGQGMGWSLLGLIAGLAGAFAGGRLLQSRLYGVTATDGVTLLAVVIGLIGVAAVACLIPAARATRVDPLTSLKAE
jgi:putative ABC transport system permease protein